MVCLTSGSIIAVLIVHKFQSIGKFAFDVLSIWCWSCFILIVQRNWDQKICILDPQWHIVKKWLWTKLCCRNTALHVYQALSVVKVANGVFFGGGLFFCHSIWTVRVKLSQIFPILSSRGRQFSVDTVVDETWWLVVLTQKMQDVASCQYKVMQLDSRRAVDMLYVNGRLIHHVRNEMGDHSYGVGSALHTYMCVCVCVCVHVCVCLGVFVWIICVCYMCFGVSVRLHVCLCVGTCATCVWIVCVWVSLYNVNMWLCESWNVYCTTGCLDLLNIIVKQQDMVHFLWSLIHHFGVCFIRLHELCFCDLRHVIAMHRKTSSHRSSTTQ